ncbi:MAG TPA: glutamate synthase subunit beta [Candidatus Binatia bacterium]|nr:glutamate synthase subunit beta [Candidatus Binatia bacterium]
MSRTGFIEHARQPRHKRPVTERVGDYREIYVSQPIETLTLQAARCMDCAVPFCHQGCPLGNLVPEWNDLVHRGDWARAISRLHLTNNFPEFTGTLCPAPCEPACVLAINSDPVTIKDIELEIVDRAFEMGLIRPEPPGFRSGRRVAVIGSGPAGLAAAQQLNRAGHRVTVYEKSDRPGGLLRYGIPDFKMEKHRLDRRLALLEAEGIVFECNYDVGRDLVVDDLRCRSDAVVCCVGAERGRDVLHLAGRQLPGIHLAMEYLVQQNLRVAGETVHAREAISATGRRVVIIGGGDTAADCLGNAHREGCAAVDVLSVYPAPPRTRTGDNPWPEWPLVLQTYPAHEEGGRRRFGVMVTGFRGHDRVEAIETVECEVRKSAGAREFSARAGTEGVIPADLVLLAIGFDGVACRDLIHDLGAGTTGRGTVAVDQDHQAAPGVFAAGDATRGASLIVWAIAEARRAAAACDRYLATLPAG